MKLISHTNKKGKITIKGPYVHPAPSERYDYVPEEKQWGYPHEIKIGHFILHYYPNHDLRYAHIPVEERWKYPDEVRTIFFGRYHMQCIYYSDHDKRYAHISPEERWGYPDELRIGHFRLIYYLDHDKRYAHIPKMERWEYPDEVIKPFLWFPVRYKRERTYDELAKEIEIQMDHEDLMLFAKDIPITRVWRYLSDR